MLKLALAMRPLDVLYHMLLMMFYGSRLHFSNNLIWFNFLLGTAYLLT